MRYYTIKYKFCQEKGFTNMDDPDITDMRQKILQALEHCNDIDILYLIFKLVIRSNALS